MIGTHHPSYCPFGHLSPISIYANVAPHNITSAMSNMTHNFTTALACFQTFSDASTVDPALCLTPRFLCPHPPSRVLATLALHFPSSLLLLLSPFLPSNETWSE